MSQQGILSDSTTPAPDIEYITGDSGGAVGPDGSGNVNLLGNTTGMQVTGNPGTNTLTVQDLRNASKYVVDANAGETEYTTIQSAINAANAAGGGVDIIVRPATYNEDLTLYDDINLVGTSASGCILVGKHTPPNTGVIEIRNFSLNGNDDVFYSTAAGDTNITLRDCITNCISGYIFYLPNWQGITGYTGLLRAINTLSIGLEEGFIYNTSLGSVITNSSSIGYGTGKPNVFSGQLFAAISTTIGCPTTFGGNSSVSITQGSSVGGTITTADNASVSISNSSINAQTVHNSTGTVSISETTINAAYPAIDGTGTLNIGSISFLNDNTIENTLTLSSFEIKGGQFISKYVVDPTGMTPYTTIQSAINIARSYGPAVIYVKPGTYTENLNFGSCPDMYIVAEPLSVEIIGQHSPTIGALAVISFNGCKLRSSTHLFSVGPAINNDFEYKNCQFNLTGGSGYLINATSGWTGSMLIDNCDDISANNFICLSTYGVDVTIENSTVGAGSTGVFTVAGSAITIDGSIINCPITINGASTATIDGSLLTQTLTTADTTATTIAYSSFFTGTNSSISHGTSGMMYLTNTSIDTTNATAIAGAGVGIIFTAGISFVRSHGIAGGLTLSSSPRNISGGIQIVEDGLGSETMGYATLAGGSVLVSTTEVTANSRIFVFPQSTLAGTLYISARVAGTSFTISSTNGADTPSVAWVILEPK